MSAIRTLRQLSLSTRALSTRTFARSAVRLPARTACVAPARVGVSAARAFSVSAAKRGEGSSDAALSHKLQEEIQYEKEASAEVGTDPEFLKAFKKQGVWTIQDKLGNDEVTLERKFGNETIRLMFSIADIQTNQEEEFEGIEGEESEEANEDQPIHSYPIRCSFSITKSSGEGSLNVDAMCQDGTFMLDNVSFYPSAALGTELTAEADWKRRGLYLGPQFDTLDVAVQEEFEKFLQERAINESLALFVPEYAEFKEQKEYVKWLDGVKSFIDL